MRPSTEQAFVDHFANSLREASNSEDPDVDFDKGFKYAYESFVHAYRKRDFD